MSTSTLHHRAYGVLDRMADETVCPNQWTGWQGVRYGTFVTKDGLFVALPLAEVTVGGES